MQSRKNQISGRCLCEKKNVCKCEYAKIPRGYREKQRGNSGYFDESFALFCVTDSPNKSPSNKSIKTFLFARAFILGCIGKRYIRGISRAIFLFIRVHGFFDGFVIDIYFTKVKVVFDFQYFFAFFFVKFLFKKILSN